jgi:hypothetical protein
MRKHYEDQETVSKVGRTFVLPITVVQPKP